MNMSNPESHFVIHSINSRNNLCFPDPCDEPVARSFLCKAEHQQSRSRELVPGQSGILAGPSGDGVRVTGGGRRESI